MSLNLVAVGVAMRKACWMFDNDPLSVNNRLRMAVRFPPMRPGMRVVSMLVTGKLPAPPLATGSQFVAVGASERLCRSSAPLLNACFPFDQLSESAYVKTGESEGWGAQP